ncbi:hypothetical protein QZH41_001637 [Actinostola sp. cb2023]|nr:hypothetical protein QZH41_001637 [Actinostola sp. cb2023]
MLATAAIGALDIIEYNTEMCDDLKKKSIQFHEELKGLRGLAVCGEEVSPIIHLRLTEQFDSNVVAEDILKQIVDLAFEENIAVTIARYLRNQEKFPPQPSVNKSSKFFGVMIWMHSVAQVGNIALNTKLTHHLLCHRFDFFLKVPLK